MTPRPTSSSPKRSRRSARDCLPTPSSYRSSSAKRSSGSSCARCCSATTTSPSATRYRTPPAASRAVRYCVHRVNVSQAANGDRVAITGEGEFQVHPKAVEAEGEFTHTDAAGTVIASGTWTATKLIAYQSYGCGVVEGDPLPPNFCGGKLKMAVVLTPDGTDLQIPAILTVFCIIGPNPPNSHDDESGEGITLVVPGVINFNKLVSGMNVYIQTR
jgi:hypothetical protein